MKKIILIILVFIYSSVFAKIDVIKFATEATYPPFVSMSPSSEIVGFDADIVRALCQQMQATCTLNNQPWESLIPSLKLGKFDALFGGIAITEEREKQVAFTKSYYHSTGSLVANRSLHLVISPEGLKGKTIGVQGGTTIENYLQEVYGKTITINRYPSLQSALLDLVADRVDAVMGDTTAMQDWVEQKGKGQYEMVGNPIDDEKYFGRGVGIAVRKDNLKLLDALNKALLAIKANGSYCKIIHKNFGHVPCRG